MATKSSSLTASTTKVPLNGRQMTSRLNGGRKAWRAFHWLMLLWGNWIKQDLWVIAVGRLLQLTWPWTYSKTGDMERITSRKNWLTMMFRATTVAGTLHQELERVRCCSLTPWLNLSNSILVASSSDFGAQSSKPCRLPTSTTHGTCQQKLRNNQGSQSSHTALTWHRISIRALYHAASTHQLKQPSKYQDLNGKRIVLRNLSERIFCG